MRNELPAALDISVVATRKILIIETRDYSEHKRLNDCDKTWTFKDEDLHNTETLMLRKSVKGQLFGD